MSGNELSKKEFVELVKKALVADERSGVADIIYEDYSKSERPASLPDFINEVITVVFNNGRVRRIDVTANGATYREIGRAVYGGGARGAIW